MVEIYHVCLLKQKWLGDAGKDKDDKHLVFR